MSKEVTPQQILNELIELATDKRLYDLIRGDIPSPKLDYRRLKFNAEQIGKMVESLPEEHREILKSLSWNDVKDGVRPPRPKEKTDRVRGPVKLSK